MLYRGITNWLSNSAITKKLRLPSDKPVDPVTVYNADRCRDQGLWEDAAKAYCEALAVAPKRGDLWVQYGHAHKELRNFPDSENAYRWANQLAPNDKEPLLHLGHVLKLQGRFGEARDAYKAALTLSPNDAELQKEARAPLAHYAVAAGDHARDRRLWKIAKQFYETALADSPALAEIWLQLGHVNREIRDFAGAEYAYRQALGLNLKDAQIWGHLGDVYKQSGKYDDAVTALASAIVLGDPRGAIRRAFDHLSGFSRLDADAALLAELVKFADERFPLDATTLNAMQKWFAHLPYSSIDPTGKWRRHSGLMRQAYCTSDSMGKAIIWLPNIDWGYRTQRAQHLASAVAARGHPVFFISPTTEGSSFGSNCYRLISSPTTNLFEVRLHSPKGRQRPLDCAVDASSAALLSHSIQQICVDFGVSAPTLIAQHPNWSNIIASLPRWRLVYDYLDDHVGFPNTSAATVDAHNAMLGLSHLVTATSLSLLAEVSGCKSAKLIRNATTPQLLTIERRPADAKPVIGYIGALAEWFDMELVAYTAKRHPDWQFVLIGEVGACSPEQVTGLDNVTLTGEIAYEILPTFLEQFSVGIIPFKLSRLTQATDPVKLYEYLAVGCPVVTSALPEIAVIKAPWVATTSSAPDFEMAIAECLLNDSDAARIERKAWASRQTWAERAAQLDKAIQDDAFTKPQVTMDPQASITLSYRSS